MQWPLASQLHGSFLKENNWFFWYSTTNILFIILQHRWQDSAGDTSGVALMATTRQTPLLAGTLALVPDGVLDKTGASNFLK
jgi:hypothetical protein